MMVKKLDIGFLSTTYHTSLIIIANRWVEEKLSIEANWKLYSSGPEEVKALEQGEIDIGYIGLPPVIIGISNKAPIKCVAAGHVDGSVLVARKRFKSLEEKGSLVEVLKQFKGEIIACPSKGSIHDIIIRKLLQQYNLEDVTIKNFSWADLILDDFADGKIHAAIGTPSLAVAIMQFCNGKILIPADKLLKNSPSYGIVTRNDFIKNSPEALEKFISLHKQATDEIKSNFRGAAKAVAELIGIVGEDFVKEVYKVSPKYFIELTDEFINATEEFVDVLVELKYIKEPVPIDDIFDFRIIKRLLKNQ